ncbi:MAG TPA: antitoxin Xre-like helix-turn-helix domain-containing protein [Terriglobales bacterium]|jgi:hypothetical protein
MDAALAVPDIGLDLGKIPNLSEAATRKRLSPAAIAAFFKIVETWDINNEDAMRLLGGVSHGRYYGLKKTRKGILTQDELTRVSFLIGIFKALNILFSRKLADQWISLANNNPMFNRASPLATLIEGGVPAMVQVRRLLDSRRGGR